MSRRPPDDAPGGRDRPLADELRALFARQRWGFVEDEAGTALRCTLEGGREPWLLAIEADEERGLLLFRLSSAPLPEDERRAAATLLTALSPAPDRALLSPPARGGSVACALPLETRRGRLIAAAVEEKIRAGGLLMEALCAAIAEVVAGAEPAAVARRLERTERLLAPDDARRFPRVEPVRAGAPSGDPLHSS